MWYSASDGFGKRLQCVVATHFPFAINSISMQRDETDHHLPRAAPALIVLELNREMLIYRGRQLPLYLHFFPPLNFFTPWNICINELRIGKITISYSPMRFHVISKFGYGLTFGLKKSPIYDLFALCSG